LVEYGIPHDDPRFDRLSFHELHDWGWREREAFRRREQAWWEGTLTEDEARIITEAIHRHSMGGVPEYPFVVRPLNYAGYGQYSAVPIDTARKLIDRGLEVVRDAQTRHHLLLAGLERESAFNLAEDPVAERRLMAFQGQLRRNRPAADRLTIAQWGGLPPSRGERYDTAAFDLAERRIAFAYRQRKEDPAALDRAIQACRAMIARSAEFLELFQELGRPLPSHKGFQQLAIILDKRGEYASAIQQCERARDEGWDGDWDRRIQRYSKRLK